MILCQDTDYLFLDEDLKSLEMKHAAVTMQLKRGTTGLPIETIAKFRPFRIAF